MLLNELKPKNPLRKKAARVGRGGKRGTYSGRGVKGQKARSGHRIRPAGRDYIQRLPKKRGSKNKPLVSPIAVVNVGDLEKKVSGNVIDKTTLPNTKILGDGEIKKAFNVKGVAVSASAKKKIEKAGGKIS